MTTGGDVQDGIRPWNNKQAAVDFLQLVVAGHIPEAYRKYVDMEGTHHNPFFPAGFPALQKAMADDHTRAPNKRITIRHILGDGELVAVHSRLDRGPEEQSYATVHIFRFQHGRIVEMWDYAQSMPVDSPNEDGTFTGQHQEPL